MANQSSNVFPATQTDLSNLKQIASDAVTDLSSTAATHASKTERQIRKLAGDVRSESVEQVERIKGHLSDLASSAKSYALERPLACLAAAFAGGFILALYFRRSRD
jgi:ElaB/YqjD/DUF883 family membrane-anchored ribosome-binding protein